MKGTYIVIAILLLIPLVALLAMPTYNSVNPTLFGISFFYWYQMLWMPLGAFLFYIAAILWNREDAKASRSATGRSKSRRRR